MNLTPVLFMEASETLCRISLHVRLVFFTASNAGKEENVIQHINSRDVGVPLETGAEPLSRSCQG